MLQMGKLVPQSFWHPQSLGGKVRWQDAEFSVALRECICCDAEKHPVSWRSSFVPCSSNWTRFNFRCPPRDLRVWKPSISATWPFWIHLLCSQYINYHIYIYIRNFDGMAVSTFHFADFYIWSALVFPLGVTRCRVKAGGTGKITVSFLPFEVRFAQISGTSP